MHNSLKIKKGKKKGLRRRHDGHVSKATFTSQRLLRKNNDPNNASRTSLLPRSSSNQARKSSMFMFTKWGKSERNLLPPDFEIEDIIVDPPSDKKTGEIPIPQDAEDERGALMASYKVKDKEEDSEVVGKNVQDVLENLEKRDLDDASVKFLLNNPETSTSTKKKPLSTWLLRPRKKAGKKRSSNTSNDSAPRNVGEFVKTRSFHLNDLYEQLDHQDSSSTLLPIPMMKREKEDETEEAKESI